MGTPREPRPAKYFVALLSAEVDLLPAVEREMVSAFGEIDGRSAIVPWNASKFYENEMGAGLRRQFLSLSNLASPRNLAAVKVKTQEIEARFCVAGSTARRINLDPGYIDTHKVVLASTKNAGQRIYLSSGIYGEATLVYFDGEFHGLPYTYPDYLWPEARDFFCRLRAGYLHQLRQLD